MKPLIVLTALLCLPAKAAEFVAYFTRVDPTTAPAAFVDKYVDLFVTLPNVAGGVRLEFLRANGYLPQWRTTTGGPYSVENLFPGKDADPYFYYNYVRLMENGPDKIVVHWRHFKDIETISMAKQESLPDSLVPHGITGVVHEVFTIHPDGSVEREVRDAANTRYQDWTDPRLITRQTLHLTGIGITHGPVAFGQKPPFLPRAAVTGNSVKAGTGLPAPIYHWNFDEGMASHDDQVTEAITNTPCEISGLMTQYKKGVSGTALALDGYYTGVSMESQPSSRQAMSAEAWVALDALPYGTAPLAHHSKGLNAAGTAITDGWYLGVDATGHATFKASLNGTAKSVSDAAVLPLYQWTHVCATVGAGTIKLYVNGVQKATTTYTPTTATVTTPSTPLLLGRNNEWLKATNLVRSTKPYRNLAFVYGIQGLLDEVGVYAYALTQAQVTTAYGALLPSNTTSDLAKGVLPANSGVASQFGASYTALSFGDVWDPLWRDHPTPEIVVNFDKNPCSVMFWRGTNYAPNWVTENHHWMADQSSEGGAGKADDTGCAEHMADKQTRHCRARIIENTPARVLIHWRYPSIGVRYVFSSPYDWSDEYYAIYPDGTGVRKVYWNNNSPPGFQDCQFLSSPGELPLDVVDLQALTVMNPAGTTADLTWTMPNTVPTNPLVDTALAELFNSKGTTYKVFALFQDTGIAPWSDYNSTIGQPFAGPWNHWPMSLCPSDGRRAQAADRVTHFSIAANDGSKGSFLVLYGFSNKTGFASNQAHLSSLLPLLKSWTSPPAIMAVSGCTAGAYVKETRSFPLAASKAAMSVNIAATAASPVVNPCFTVKNWNGSGTATVTVPGATDIRQGTIVDTDGTRTLVVWAEVTATSTLNVTLSGANLPN